MTTPEAPGQSFYGKFVSRWKGILNVMKRVSRPKKRFRAFDQVMDFRDSVLDIVGSGEFIDQLARSFAFGSPNKDLDPKLDETKEGLLAEMKSVSKAHLVGKSSRRDERPKKFRQWLASLVKTVIGSIKDLVTPLSDWVKNGLILAGELMDFVRA